MLSNLPVQQPIKKKRLLSSGQIALFDHEIRLIQRQKNRDKAAHHLLSQKPSVPEKESRWQHFSLLALLLIFFSVWSCT